MKKGRQFSCPLAAGMFAALVLALTLPGTSTASSSPGVDYELFSHGADKETVIVSGSNRGLGLGWVKH